RRVGGTRAAETPERVLERGVDLELGDARPRALHRGEVRLARDRRRAADELDLLRALLQPQLVDERGGVDDLERPRDRPPRPRARVRSRATVSRRRRSRAWSSPAR